MNNTSAARTSSSVALAVTLALSQLAFSNVAQADSAREWGYWDASTAAGPGGGGSDGFSSFNADNTNTTQNNTNQNFDGDQRIFGVNPELSASAVQGSYVGYTLCYYGCDGVVNVNGEESSYSYAPKTAGTVSINITQGAERVAQRSSYVYPYLVNGVPYFIQDSTVYDAQVAVNGTFNGEAFNLNDGQSQINKNETTYYNGSTISNSYVSSETNNASFRANLNNSYNGFENNNLYNSGDIYTNNSSGQLLFGKPVAATQIAEQLRLGQIYNFNGSSYRGSYVQIAVNFQNASWSGTWGQSYDYNNYDYQTNSYPTLQNGFAATGGISGSTLTSSSVVGAGNAGVGFVTGGKVDATLVGAITGTDASAAAIIGKTVVNVQQAVGITTVGDIFQAQVGRGCKGCDI